MSNKSPESNSEQFNETREYTEWDTLEGAESPAAEKVNVKAIMDSVEVPELNFPDDDTPESTETSPEYAATNKEIYDSVFTQLSRDIFVGENNGNPPEVIKAKADTRDILIDIHLTNMLNVENGEPEIPLTTAIEQRKAVYDQKVELYQKLGDTERAKENINLSTRATELISYTNAAKKNIEDHKDPNSNYNQLANQFK